MDWMHTHQLSSKNLTAGEKLAMTIELQKEIALENKEKVSKAVIESNKNRTNSNCVQMDACEKSARDRSTNTREQVAKMSGVGTGTVARYDAIMKTDDEAKQRKVAVEYVKLCGYKQGRPQKESNMDCLSLDEIASQLGTSKTNLKRALSIERNLTESMKQLLDDGVISKTDQQRSSADVLRNLKEFMVFSMEQLCFKGINIMRCLRKFRNHQTRNN